MSLKVIASGTHSLLVDGGRPRTRRLGVCVGGPADRASFMLGNALCGNLPVAPALEITLSGPTLLALDDVGLCIFGSPFQIDRDGELVMPNHTFALKKGQTLRIGGTPEGCRAYLCVADGFRAREILGSATGFEPIKPSDVLVSEASYLPGRSIDFAAGENRSGFVASPDRNPTGSTIPSSRTLTWSRQRAIAWAFAWMGRR